MDPIKNLLARGVEESIEKDHLESALRSGKKLRVKFGIDPTAPDLHLGHTVVLRKLRQFQSLGHRAVLIIGDFTAQVGDPSGRSEERRPLSEKEIKNNLKDYLTTTGKIIDVRRAEIRYNSEWYRKNGLPGFLEIMKKISVSQVLEREDFQKRMKAGNEISILEEIYPVLQGYDSVAVQAHLELGGTDQKFNLLMGRRVQRAFNMPEQDIITMPLLEGTDGTRKMSKSYGNYIGLNDPPDDMFGKIMRIPDNLIDKYFLLLTDLDRPKNLKPYEAKLMLAETLVEMYHKGFGKKARENFLKVFSKKELPEDIPELKIRNYELGIVELLLEAGVKSKSEARRLIEQNAVELNGKILNNPNEKLELKGGEILRVGKKNFFRVREK